LKKMEEQLTPPEKEDVLLSAMELLLPSLQNQSHLEQQQAFKVLKVVLEKYKELDAIQDFRLAGSFFKQGGKFKSWKDRWFVVGDESIMYFKDRKDFEVGPGKKGWNTRGSIDYADITNFTSCNSEICQDPHVKSNRPRKGTYCIHVHTATRNYPILGFAKEDTDIWINTLKQVHKKFDLRRKTLEWVRQNSDLQDIGPRSWGSMRLISKDNLLNNIDLIHNKEAEEMLEKLMNSYETVGVVKKYVLKDLFLSAVEKKGKWLNAKEFFAVVLTEDEYFHRDLIEQLESVLSRRRAHQKKNL